MTAAIDTLDLQALAERQRAQAVFWTQRDVWLTAAIMTLFLGPLGLLFGSAALLALRGLRKSIVDGQAELSVRRLRHGRRLVFLGLAFSVLLNVLMLIRSYLTFSSMSAQLQQSAQESRHDD